MAALRIEHQSDTRQQVTRLGHRHIEGHVHTWRMFVNFDVQKSGHVWVQVVRDGRVVHTYTLEPETQS